MFPLVVDYGWETDSTPAILNDAAVGLLVVASSIFGFVVDAATLR